MRQRSSPVRAETRGFRPGGARSRGQPEWPCSAGALAARQSAVLASSARPPKGWLILSPLLSFRPIDDCPGEIISRRTVLSRSVGGTRGRYTPNERTFRRQALRGICATSSPSWRSPQSRNARTSFVVPFSSMGYGPGVALSQSAAAECWHDGAQSRKCYLQSPVTDRATVAPSRR